MSPTRKRTPASPTRSSPPRSSPKRSSPKRSSPTRSSPKRSSPRRSSPRRSSPPRSPVTRTSSSNEFNSETSTIHDSDLTPGLEARIIRYLESNRPHVSPMNRFINSATTASTVRNSPLSGFTETTVCDSPKSLSGFMGSPIQLSFELDEPPKRRR